MKSPHTSGTEEEYHVARECHADPGRRLRQIVAFFKGVPAAQLADPGTQLTRVLEFRRKLECERDLLYHAFDRAGEFERTLRALLAKWRRDHEDGNTAKATTPQGPTLMPPPAEEISFPLASSRNSETIKKAWSRAEDGATTEAETLFAEAVAAGDDPEAFRSYGAFLLRMGRAAQAEAIFRRILDVTTPVDQLWRAIAYGNIGVARELAGDFAVARKMHQKSLTLHQRLHRPDGISQTQNNLGIIAKREGDLEAAEQAFTVALDNARQAGRSDTEGRALNNLGLLYREQGDLNKAESMFRNALAIAEQNAQTQAIVTASANLGIAYFDLGRTDDADGTFSRVLQLSRQIGFQEGIAISSAGLAAILLQRGDLAAAEPLLRAALEINVQMERPEGVANMLVNLAVLEARRGNFEDATYLLHSALETFEKIAEPFGRATTEEKLGDLYAGMGNRTQAQQWWAQARDRFESLGIIERAAQIQKRVDTSG
jgi:tetratricopeptide (TPR) repeat protein